MVFLCLRLERGVGMTVIAWSEAYSVGSARIDSDHRILFSLFAQLHEALETGQGHDVVGSVVNVLAEYVEEHFRHEDQLMERAGYPDRVRHQESHRVLERQVRDIRDRWMEGEHHALSQDVLVVLRNWLSDHILVADIAYRPWVEAADAASAS